MLIRNSIFRLKWLFQQSNLLFCALGFLWLAGCSKAPDPEQLRLCHYVLPALYAPSEMSIVRANRYGVAGVEILFHHNRLSLKPHHPLQDGAVDVHQLICQFAGSGLSVAKRKLMRLSLDGIALGEAQLFFIRELWLEEQISGVEQISANSIGQFILDVPRGVAIAAQYAVTMLPKMGIYILLAVSFSLLYGLIGRINLAFGEFAALGGIAAVIGAVLFDALLQRFGGEFPLYLSVLAMFLAAIVCAASYGFLAARFAYMPVIKRGIGQHMLIISVGILLVLQEYLRLVQGAGTRWLAPIYNLPIPFVRAGDFTSFYTPIAILTFAIAAISAVGLLLYMAYSRFGKEWQAMAQEPIAAALCGISQERILTQCFIIACGLAGISGALVALFYGGIGFAGGTMLGLSALVAAIIGGIGSLSGAFYGAIVLSLIETLWSALMPIEFRDIAIFSLLILLLALRPEGFITIKST